jgi:hypothetical protein
MWLVRGAVPTGPIGLQERATTANVGYRVSLLGEWHREVEKG